jgi:hypothetical protein
MGDEVIWGALRFEFLDPGLELTGRGAAADFGVGTAPVKGLDQGFGTRLAIDSEVKRTVALPPEGSFVRCVRGRSAVNSDDNGLAFGECGKGLILACRRFGPELSGDRAGDHGDGQARVVQVQNGAESSGLVCDRATSEGDEQEAEQATAGAEDGAEDNAQEYRCKWGRIRHDCVS